MGDPTNNSPLNSNGVPNKALEGWMILLIISMLAIVVGLILWILKSENHRKLKFHSFMKDAIKEFGAVEIPTAIVAAHEKLRRQLYDRYFGENSHDLTDRPLFVDPSNTESSSSSKWPKEVATADEIFQENGNLENSWQRHLDNSTKALLKTALLKRAVATIPRYKTMLHEYGFKMRLYERQLISDKHWLDVKSNYDDTCEQMKFIIFEANCLEDCWGSRPDGMLKTAQIIVAHEEAKLEKEESDRRQKKLEEKEKKQKERMQQMDLDKLAKQKRNATRMMEMLLRDEEDTKSNTRRKKKT